MSPVTTQPLLTISAFARAVDLAPSALRYYDEAGLLPPAEVDPKTGYRYYTPELARRAHLVRRMREIGVPVDSMRLVLDGPPSTAAQVLRGFAERAADRARLAANAVEEIVAALRENDPTPASVTVFVDGAELGAALRRVGNAADREPGPLAGVLLDIADSSLTVVATDRYWLASWSLPLAESQVSARRVFVPRPAVGELAGWLARRGTVVLEATKDSLRVRDEPDEHVVTVAEDRFPAYRMIEDDLPVPVGRVTLEREPLLRLVTVAEGNLVRLVVGADRCAFSQEDSREGTHLDAVTSGKPATLRFSATLLRSALTALVGSEVTVEYAAADRAVRLGSAEQRRLSVLLMPAGLDR